MSDSLFYMTFLEEASESSNGLSSFSFLIPNPPVYGASTPYKVEKTNPPKLNIAHGKNSKLLTPSVVAINTPETVQGIKTSVIVTESSMLLDKFTGCNVYPGSDAWKLEKRKWRFGILIYLKSIHQDDFEKLLNMVAEVYAYMGYPEDIESFINNLSIS
ncbi:DUF2247 family protein [Halobacillus hunanensis]|uniref:DUF2247 family protein n=1 Tax=Halobacillus hunanensis TaxID=578214 RepID=UPI002481AD06|nr:DUF2247 family protein [Halobacillus hunanensis]